MQGSEADVNDEQERTGCRPEGDGSPAPLMEGKPTGPESSERTEAARQVRVSNKMGLHARPAMQFVDLANRFTSRVRVCKEQQCVDAKSIMELLLLAAAAGTHLTIHAEGPDADQAVEALTKLVERKFDEE